MDVRQFFYKLSHSDRLIFNSLHSIFSLSPAFVFKHARVPITIDAIPDIRPDNKTAFAVLQYREENVKKTKLTSQTTTTATQKPQSILRRFIYYFWPMLLQLIAWSLLQPWFTVLPPFFVNRLLRWTTLRDQGEPVQYGTAVLSILGIFASITARTLISASAITLSARLGIRANAILSAELYTKLLRRKEVLKPPTKNENGEAEEQASAGKAQNVISVDAGRGG